MRLSRLVGAAILLLSVTLLAQHASGGGGGSSSASSAGASSHSSFGGSSSSVASHVSSTHVSGTSHGSSSISSSSTQSKSNLRTPVKDSANAKAEKKGFFSFMRHKKPAPVTPAEADFKRRVPCKKGQPCNVCPGGGTRNSAGNCGYPQICSTGLGWNGFACGSQYGFSNCRILADQITALQGQMAGKNDPGLSLRYQLLREQYEQCLARSRSFAFSAMPLPPRLSAP